MAPIPHEDLKNKLVLVAVQIVQKEGYAGLNVRRAASMAGCAIGMVYKIFDNMDDLAIHVNADTLDRLNDALARPCSSDDPKEAVQELADRYIIFSRDNFNLWSMLFEHRMERPLPDWFRQKIAQNFGHVEKAMAPLIASGPAVSADHAKVLWASLHGICSLSITGKLDTVGAQSASTLAVEMINNYMAGLAIRMAGLAARTKREDNSNI
ncbi:MAG: WHG domain-containing protein [Nitrospinota bacterium]|nr:WHG domain-containing protein [Nitrospinota bacterium]